MIRVLLNGLQAGNLSGTGRYTTELARRLPGLSEDLDARVLWPAHVHVPLLMHPEREPFQVVESRAALRRVWMDQVGIRAVRRRLDADIVHYPANVGPLASMRGVVLTVHDLSFLRDPQWHRRDRAAYYRFAVSRSVRVAVRIIVDSEAAAEDLRVILRVPPERIDVIPLGVGEEFHAAIAEAQATARAWYKLPEQFFLYVGTIEPRKNLVRLIEAWSRVALKCPQDLVIAGREGWKTGPVHAAANGSLYAERIHFPGFIAHEDLPAVLTAAHAFVWPSLYEGFGLPPLEAMACGTPVIASNVTSLPEVVGAAALTVDPMSVDQLAEALLDLAENASLHQSLRAKGLRRAALFTWDRTAQLTHAAYRAVRDSL